MNNDDVAILGWVIATFGMILHLIGTYLELWAFDNIVTFMIPIVGFLLMTLATGADY